MIDVSSLVIDMQSVTPAPSWRKKSPDITFAYLKEEPNGATMLALHQQLLPNCDNRLKIISPFVLNWSQLFHPRFHHAVCKTDGRASDMASAVKLCLTDGTSPEPEQLAMTWLQSMLFLAAVTLSAAIVQKRYSLGTIQSKYDRLWQAGALDRLAIGSNLEPLQLCDRVKTLANDKSVSDLSRLLQLRSMFEEAIHCVTRGSNADGVSIQPSCEHSIGSRKFGFTSELIEFLGDNLLCVIVYGSSVSSSNFADYDVILLCKNSETALRKLSGKSPTWNGKEINMGVYNLSEFWNMQLLSGDNLADYGVCLYGEAVVPHKPIRSLLFRNLSFGMIRLRQQLGMLSDSAVSNFRSEKDDKRNLYSYFTKIPANIVKGTFGANGDLLTKELAHQWLYKVCEFDTEYWQNRAYGEKPEIALSESASATVAALQELNRKFGIVVPKI